MQLDVTKDEVYQVIKNEASEEERKKTSLKQLSNTSSLGMFYLDAVININLAIKHAQHSMCEALKGGPEFNISMVEETQNILKDMQNLKSHL